MEKVLYVLDHGAEPPPGLGDLLRGEVAARLLDLGAHHLSVDVADEWVARAAHRRIVSSGNPPSAVVAVWLDSANDALRAPFDAAVALAGGTASAYLVTESVALRLPADAVDEDGRVHGMAHVAFLRRRPDLTVEEWFDTWLNHHTQVAIDTQDTFCYVQHPVARVLTPGAVPWDAIVEECFPEEAMDDDHAFFDAGGDDDRLSDNRGAMFESVQRFIDLSQIVVVATSRYDIA